MLLEGKIAIIKSKSIVGDKNKNDMRLSVNQRNLTCSGLELEGSLSS